MKQPPTSMESNDIGTMLLERENKIGRTAGWDEGASEEEGKSELTRDVRKLTAWLSIQPEKKSGRLMKPPGDQRQPLLPKGGTEKYEVTRGGEGEALELSIRWTKQQRI